VCAAGALYVFIFAAYGLFHRDPDKQLVVYKLALCFLDGALFSGYVQSCFSLSFGYKKTKWMLPVAVLSGLFPACINFTILYNRIPYDFESFNVFGFIIIQLFINCYNLHYQKLKTFLNSVKYVMFPILVSGMMILAYVYLLTFLLPGSTLIVKLVLRLIAHPVISWLSMFLWIWAAPYSDPAISKYGRYVMMNACPYAFAYMGRFVIAEAGSYNNVLLVTILSSLQQLLINSVSILFSNRGVTRLLRGISGDSISYTVYI